MVLSTCPHSLESHVISPFSKPLIHSWPGVAEHIDRDMGSLRHLKCRMAQSIPQTAFSISRWTPHVGVRICTFCPICTRGILPCFETPTPTIILPRLFDWTRKHFRLGWMGNFLLYFRNPFSFAHRKVARKRTIFWVKPLSTLPSNVVVVGHNQSVSLILHNCSPVRWRN